MRGVGDVQGATRYQIDVFFTLQWMHSVDNASRLVVKASCPAYTNFLVPFKSCNGGV